MMGRNFHRTALYLQFGNLTIIPCQEIVRSIFLRLALTLAISISAASAEAETTFPDGAGPQSLVFEIRRHGDVIGSHALSFRQLHGRTEVTIDISVKVTVFTLVAYRFEQHGTEIWDGGKLKSLTIDTDDNGEIFKVVTTASGGKLRAVVNGEATEYESMPLATLWRPAPLNSTRLLDPTDGKPSKITISDLGEEAIAVRGKSTQARHWRWDGDLKRNLWFDSTGMLVQVHVKGDDGSDIYYILK